MKLVPPWLSTVIKMPGTITPKLSETKSAVTRVRGGKGSYRAYRKGLFSVSPLECFGQQRRT